MPCAFFLLFGFSVTFCFFVTTSVPLSVFTLTVSVSYRFDIAAERSDRRDVREVSAGYARMRTRVSWIGMRVRENRRAGESEIALARS